MYSWQCYSNWASSCPVWQLCSVSAETAYNKEEWHKITWITSRKLTPKSDILEDSNSTESVKISRSCLPLCYTHTRTYPPVKMQRTWSVPSSKNSVWAEFKSNLYNQASQKSGRLNGNKLCLLPIAVSGDDKALIFAVLLWAWNWTEDGWKRRKRENREAEKSCVEKGERKYRLPSYKAKLLMRWCPPNLKSMLQIIRVVLHTE